MEKERENIPNDEVKKFESDTREIQIDEIQPEDLPKAKEETPQPPKKQDPAMAKLVSIVAIVVGAFHALYSATAVVAMVAGVVENWSIVGLFVVLALIGILQIVAGIMGLKSIGNEAMQEKCKGLGWVMLIACAGFVVTSFMLRGFEWSTLLGLIVAIGYIATIKPGAIQFGQKK
ncbi:hypothetical protein LJC07_07680 [Christensenellaceae bacterium OttesenSCG-928-L17]|nr:hypothetical protein [Christensenellaceae bacterium OttesenSCG-928-L17]